MKTPHLDDDAFAELSMGEALPPEAQAHLAACTTCQEELARFQDSVGSFNLASLAWSERKSEQLPPVRVAPEKPVSGRLYPALSWALAALLAMGVAIPVKLHFDSRADVLAQGPESDDPSGLNSPEQIARDNQLMADVNYELIHSQAVLVSQYSSAASRHGHENAGTKAGTTRNQE